MSSNSSIGKLQEAWKIYLASDKNITVAAEKMGVRKTTMYHYLHLARKKGLNRQKIECTKDFAQDSGTITTKSLNISTVEEALQYAQVDLSKWQVERSKINSWEVTMGAGKDRNPQTYTNWQVTVWLKKKSVSHADAVKELIAKIPTLQFKIPKADFATMNLAMELCPFDLHLGKMAWGKETGELDYDLKIARAHFRSVIDEHLEYAKWHRVRKIVYILGQDLMHTENYLPVTSKAGNILDVDNRFPKILSEAKAITLEALYKCIWVAPTEVIWIPGNHDMQGSLYMSEIVKEHFRGEERIAVDNNPKQKKARLWGNLLVGWTHDASRRQVNLVNVLPQFFSELWGQSKFREWHTGHKHKKDEVKYLPVLTEGGTIIRQIPTLSQIDAWHVEHDYVSAVPATESFIWTPDRGICAHYTANITEDRGKPKGDPYECGKTT